MTVQHETNETHGHLIFLRRGAYPGQNPFIEALPYRGDGGRLFYKTAPRVSLRLSLQSHYGR